MLAYAFLAYALYFDIWTLYHLNEKKLTKMMKMAKKVLQTRQNCAQSVLNMWIKIENGMPSIRAVIDLVPNVSKISSKTKTVTNFVQYAGQKLLWVLH